MKLIIEMNRDEIQREIHYMFICETREGSRWNTGTRRRKWAALTDAASRRRYARLFKIANQCQQAKETR
jgi:hypothetical protein